MLLISVKDLKKTSCLPRCRFVAVDIPCGPGNYQVYDAKKLVPNTETKDMADVEDEVEVL